MCGVLRRWVPTWTTRLVLARGGEHGLAFADIDTDGFLHVDVGAGFDGGDHGESMPMIGRGDENDVEIFLLQHLAVICCRCAASCRSAWRVAVISAACEQHLAIDVAEGDDFDGGDLKQTEEVGFAVPAGADDSDAPAAVVGIAGGGQGQTGGAGV